MDFGNLNYAGYAKTGMHTVIIAVAATVFGNTLEKAFIGKPDMFALLQLLITGIAYDFVRDFYQPDPEAWVGFAACVFTAQPSLIPRVKRLIKLQ